MGRMDCYQAGFEVHKGMNFGCLCNSPDVWCLWAFMRFWFDVKKQRSLVYGFLFGRWSLEGNERAVRAVLCAVCAQFGARCFINPPFFRLVTAGCKHYSPTSISRACARAAGSKICDHPPPSARGGTPGDRRP